MVILELHTWGYRYWRGKKSVFKVNPNNQPDIAQYSYCIERQLKPEARKDIIELLDELEIKPNAMIDAEVMVYPQKYFTFVRHQELVVIFMRTNYLQILIQ